MKKKKQISKNKTIAIYLTKLYEQMYIDVVSIYTVGVYCLLWQLWLWLNLRMCAAIELMHWKKEEKRKRFVVKTRGKLFSFFYSARD